MGSGWTGLAAEPGSLGTLDGLVFAGSMPGDLMGAGVCPCGGVAHCGMALHRLRFAGWRSPGGGAALF